MLAHCDGCTTAYAVGLVCCPHCGGGESHPQGQPVLVDRGGLPLCPHCRKDVEVAKVTVHGGASNVKADPPADAPVDADVEAVEADEVEADEVEADEVEGGPVRPALNATTDAWADYVETLGGAVYDDDTRTTLIARADELEVG